MPNQSGLQRSNAERAKEAREKALQAITRLKAENQQVNFSTVSKESGLSRCFLYRNRERKSLIEEQRKCYLSEEVNRRAHFDKTSKSKDVIIAAKDKRIAKLEEEIRRLKAEVATLRGIVYACSKTTADTCSRRDESNNSGG